MIGKKVEIRKIDTFQLAQLTLPKPASVWISEKGFGFYLTKEKRLVATQDLEKDDLVDNLSHGVVMEIPGFERMKELRVQAGLQLGNYPFVPKMGGMLCTVEGKIYFCRGCKVKNSSVKMRTEHRP